MLIGYVMMTALIVFARVQWLYAYLCVGFCVARFDLDGQCETPEAWDE